MKFKDMEKARIRKGWQIVRLVIAVFAIVFFLSSIIGVHHLEYVSLDGSISTQMTHTDGVAHYYPGNHYGQSETGDVLEFTVNLPEEEKLENGVLCFFNYNSVVTVKYGDEVLAQGPDETQIIGRVTGHQIFRVPIPEEAWGGSLTIVERELETHTSSYLYNVNAMSAEDAWLYPLTYNSQAQFNVFQILLIISGTLLVILLFIDAFSDAVKQAVWMAVFCILLSLWVMGYTGLVYLICDNWFFTSQGEYFTIYLAPCAFYAYMQYTRATEKERKGFLWLKRITFVLALTALISEYCFRTLGVAFFLPLLHGLIAGGALYAVIVLIRHRREEHDMAQRLVTIGVAASMCLCVLELVRIYLTQSALVLSSWGKAFARTTIVPYVIAVLEATFMASTVMRVLASLKLKREEEQLERLAYIDQLVLIPNRTSLMENINALEDCDTYTMFFLDVDDLKMANDQYGHENGDELLKTVGRILHDAFGYKQGFYGRYGGDEFVACIMEEAQVQQFENDFHAEIMKFNAEHPDRQIHIAMGRADHSSGSTVKAMDVLHQADECMYQDKARQKGKDAVR